MKIKYDEIFRWQIVTNNYCHLSCMCIVWLVCAHVDALLLLRYRCCITILGSLPMASKIQEENCLPESLPEFKYCSKLFTTIRCAQFSALLVCDKIKYDENSIAKNFLGQKCPNLWYLETTCHTIPIPKDNMDPLAPSMHGCGHNSWSTLHSEWVIMPKTGFHNT